MHSQLPWWLPVVIAVSVISALVFALRVGEERKATALVLAPLLAAGNTTAVLVVAANPSSWSTVFGWLAVPYAVGSVLAFHRFSGAPEGRRAQLKDLGLSAALAFAMPVTVALTTRAYDASWSANSASAVIGCVAVLAAFAVRVGTRAYSRLKAAEKRRGQRGKADRRLLLVVLCGLGVVASAVPVFVLLGRPLGIELPYDEWPALGHWFTGWTVVTALVLSGLGVVVARLVRPKGVADGVLRVDVVAASLAAGGMGTAAVAMAHDAVTHGPSWPLVSWYVVGLSVLVGLFYAEDVITSTVLLHLLKATPAAWSLVLLTAVSTSIATYWMIERQLWSGPYRGVPFSSAAATLGQFSLFLLTVVAAGLVLAFASAQEQQLTAKSAVSNILQGQAIYAFLMAVVCWLPSVVAARLGTDLLADWKPVVAVTGLSWLMWRLYIYSCNNNVEHQEDEWERAIPRLSEHADRPWRAGSAEVDFFTRLQAHHRRQDRLTKWLFVGSLIGVFVLFAKGKDSLESDLGATRRPRFDPLGGQRHTDDDRG